MQIHGALGVTDDTVLSFWFREERAARIYDGPDEVHRMVVARNELRRYFQKLDKTEELVENNYYRLPIESQLAGLVTAQTYAPRALAS